MRLIEHFDKGADRFPDRAFLVDGDLVRTYTQVRTSSHRIANALSRAGLVPGMKAAVYSGNAARAFECLLGIIRAGLVWVPVNARNTVPDSAYTMQSCDVDMLFYQKAFAANIQALTQLCPKIRHLVCIDESDDKVPSLDTFIAGCADVSPAVIQGDEDPVTLYNSGGTTGLPKAIVMTNRSWETMALGAQILMKTENPVHLVAAPMTHAAGGSALAYSVLGMTNVMLPGFEPKMVMEAIQRHRVTHMFLPPTAIYRLLAHPDVRKYDYSSLRFFTYASAPMSVEKLKEAVNVFGPVMTNSFGQSETGINGTFLFPDEVARAVKEGNDRMLASVGREGPTFRVEIMDDDGKLLPPGTPGEIVMRGGQIFFQYYKNPEATAAAKAFGWHHTGDIGVKDEQGYIYVVDRKKDMIISGGFNIYPADVERIVINHPAVQDCAVVGAPHDEWGELVTAVVELKQGATLSEQEVIAWCRSKLSGVQTPKAVQFIKELPRSPVGKVLRRKVREPFWAGREKKI